MRRVAEDAVWAGAMGLSTSRTIFHRNIDGTIGFAHSRWARVPGDEEVPVEDAGSKQALSQPLHWGRRATFPSRSGGRLGGSNCLFQVSPAR